MYIKLTFNLYGEDFNAKDSITALKSKELNSVYDEEFENHISFVHRRVFSDDYWDEDYEDAYFDFIEKNIEILSKLGAKDFDLFIDVYKSDNEQCNFEILSPKFFYYLDRYKIRLPISIYTINEGDNLV